MFQLTAGLAENMNQQPQPQYDFHYQKVELIKTESLGIGSYGAVCKAACDDLPCAAKILHPALFQFTAPETTSVMQKFEQECSLLSAIKHPHIVQYLGTFRDPESNLPVLLMELMDESLTRFLEQAQEPLPYHTEVNLCHDISLALSYLHSNGIIHRDLSSNNVLLTAGSRAKVTDFGMVKLYDVNRSTVHLTPLTLCPGTVAYMSPEALGEPPVYTDKLDSFSLGVLGVQIMTRQFPDPGNRFQVIEISDPRIPSGRVQVEVAEVEHRQSHISLIDTNHPLLPVTLDCLKDKDRERPSCHEICGCISTLKASPMYTESVRQYQEREVQRSQQIQCLQQLMHGQHLEIQKQKQQIQGLRNLLTATSNQMQTQIASKDRQLASNDEQLASKDEQLASKSEQLAGKDKQLAGKDHQLQHKEAEIATLQHEIQQLRQQLQSSEQVMAEFQQSLLEKEVTVQDQQRQIQELHQQLRLRDCQRQEEEEESSGAAVSEGSMKLKWRDGGRAPRKVYGEAVAVKGNVAYFQPSGQYIVLAYDSTKSVWFELPRCPNCNFSLAVINDLLTAIGGRTPEGKLTSTLLSLTDKKWTEQFPPMPTKRWLTAVVCSARSLVVAGGTGGVIYLSTVEVMDMETLQWSTASSLPHQLTHVTATLCGDQIYMLGGRDQSDKFCNLVFTCSLAALLQSCQSRSQGSLTKTSSLASGPKVWHHIADTPVIRSTCASLRGQLLAVGGDDSDEKETTAIHAYNTTTNSWEIISHMATPRSSCLVAVLPHNELMVVGGFACGGSTDAVEFATIN